MALKFIMDNDCFIDRKTWRHRDHGGGNGREHCDCIFRIKRTPFGTHLACGNNNNSVPIILSARKDWGRPYRFGRWVASWS
jgi:hypothetical protein